MAGWHYNKGKCRGGPMHGYNVAHAGDVYRFTQREKIEAEPSFEGFVPAEKTVTVHTYLWKVGSAEWIWQDPDGK